MDTKIKAVLYTGKTYKDGSHPIMIRITQNRKRIYKAVGHSVVPDAWNDENHCVYEKYPKITKRQEGELNLQRLAERKEKYKNAIVLNNAGTINTDISDKLAEVSGLTQKLKVNEESLDLKNIKTMLNPQELGDRNKSFITFANEYRDKFLAAGSVGTYKSYKSILTKLEDHLNKKDLLFADVTVQFLQDYKAHLQSIDNKVNTIHKNLKSIRAIYYAAIAQQIIPMEKNPFFVFKLTQDNNVKKDKLTVEEIVAIEKLKLNEGSLIWHARNFFLFSFYCAGIRASDALQLKWKNLSSDGRIEYRMDKTGHHKSIGLIPKANAILKQYRPAKPNPEGFIFPFIDPSQDLTNDMTLYNQISIGTALVNKYLKDVATAADITKTISTHIARHSFSDIARKRKASVYDISKMLGHSSIKITEAYLASFDVDSQDEAMKSIMDF